MSLQSSVQSTHKKYWGQDQGDLKAAYCKKSPSDPQTVGLLTTSTRLPNVTVACSSAYVDLLWAECQRAHVRAGATRRQPVPLSLSPEYHLRLQCFSPGSYAACKCISLIIGVHRGPPPRLMTALPGILPPPEYYPPPNTHTHAPGVTWKNCVSSTQENAGVFVLLDNIMGWCIIRLQCHFKKPWIQIMGRRGGRRSRIDGAFSNPVG